MIIYVNLSEKEIKDETDKINKKSYNATHISTTIIKSVAEDHLRIEKCCYIYFKKEHNQFIFDYCFYVKK